MKILILFFGFIWAGNSFAETIYARPLQEVTTYNWYCASHNKFNDGNNFQSDSEQAVVDHALGHLSQHNGYGGNCTITVKNKSGWTHVDNSRTLCGGSAYAPEYKTYQNRCNGNNARWVTVQYNCPCSNPATCPKEGEFTFVLRRAKAKYCTSGFSCKLYPNDKQDDPFADLSAAYCTGQDTMTVPEYQPGACTDGGTDPINLFTKAVVHEETDYYGNGPFPLKFHRHYNSKIQSNKYLGAHWRSYYERGLSKAGPVLNDDKNIWVKSSGGFLQSFKRQSGGSYLGYSKPGSKMARALNESSEQVGWDFHDEYSNEKVEYDNNGRAIRILNNNGFAQNLDYDSDGNLIKVTDPLGRSLVFTHDGAGRISTMTDPGGGIYSYEYDGNGSLVKVTYPDGTDVEYVYQNDRYGNPTTYIKNRINEKGTVVNNWWYLDPWNWNFRAKGSCLAGCKNRVDLEANGYRTIKDGINYEFKMVNRLGRALFTEVGYGKPRCRFCTSLVGRKFNYNNNGKLSSKLENNGYTTAYQRNSVGLITKKTEAQGSSTETSIDTIWDNNLRKPTSQDSPDRIMTYAYDGRGLMVRKIETDKASGNSREWNYSYNALGRLTQFDGPLPGASDTTVYEYDENGENTAIVNPLGHRTSFARDAHGRVSSITDPNGLVKNIEYNSRGKISKLIVNGLESTYEYSLTGKLTRVNYPNGAFVERDYNNNDKVSEVRDSTGTAVKYYYDNNLNRNLTEYYSTSGDLLRSFQKTYDSENQVIKEVDSYNNEYNFTYDLSGNVKTVSTPLGKNYTAYYSPFGRDNRKTLADGSEVKFKRVSGGGLDAVYDTRDNITDYDLGPFSFVKKIINPDFGEQSYTYDNLGNVTSVTNSAGTVNLEYDELSRLTKMTLANGEVINLGYDEGSNNLGKLTSVTASNYSYSFDYDLLGNMTKKIFDNGGDPLEYQYQYSLLGQLDRVIYPSGAELVYHYNTGVLTGMSIEREGSSLALASNINFLSIGLVESYDLNSGVSVTNSFDENLNLKETESNISHYSFVRDSEGKITQVTDEKDASKSKTYLYDNRDRVIQTEDIFGQTQYQYDAAGNRLDLSLTPNSENNRYTELSYDVLGNRSSLDDLDIEYDEEGRPLRVLKDSEVISEYKYNFKGERIQKKVDKVAINYIYNDKGQLVSEFDENNKAYRDYIYLNNKPFAVIVHQNYPNPDTGSSYPQVSQILANGKAEADALLDQGIAISNNHKVKCENTPVSIARADSMLLEFQAEADRIMAVAQSKANKKKQELELVNSTSDFMELLMQGEGEGKGIFFFHNDHLGTPQKLSNTNGDIVWSADYKTYGEATVGVDFIANHIRLPGQYYDYESGLHYNYYRYYNPKTGRYIQPDPVGINGGLNLYVYSENDPINLRDSSGLIPSANGKTYVEADNLIDSYLTFPLYEAIRKPSDYIDNVKGNLGGYVYYSMQEDKEKTTCMIDDYLSKCKKKHGNDAAAVYDCAHKESLKDRSTSKNGLELRNAEHYFFAAAAVCKAGSNPLLGGLAAVAMAGVTFGYTGAKVFLPRATSMPTSGELYFGYKGGFDAMGCKLPEPNQKCEQKAKCRE